MKTLQRKILAYILLVGVIPMIFIGSLYYYGASKEAEEKLNEESYSILESISYRITSKTASLQSSADILFTDPDFQRALRESGESGDYAAAEIEEYLNRLFRVERKLETIVMQMNNGDFYVSGQELERSNPIRFVMEYGRLPETAGVISWLGIKQGGYNSADDKKIVAGTMLRDNAYIKDQKYLAGIYMVFSGDIFSVDDTTIKDTAKDGDVKAEEIIDTVYANKMIGVYKNTGTELIYSEGLENGEDLLSKLSIREVSKIYGTDSGKIEVLLGKAHYVIVYNTDETTNYKYISAVPASLYHSQNSPIALAAIIGILVIFVLWYAINYIIVRRITMPIREINKAMKEVENENLDVSLNIRSKDEFGLIGRQFNKMLDTIKNLLERVRNEEQKRKESDILMLQYQMNPHFLYNTIAAIRMEAIMNKQHNIDKMLLILGRFLRNTIVRGTDLLSVEEEIENIKDYIALMQLRYSNQIETEIKVEEEVKALKIPGMLIQPIIENAVMHGLNERFDGEQSAELKIKVEKATDKIHIRVYDNGRGMDNTEISAILKGFEKPAENGKNDRKHIGLKNIHRRVTMMFGDMYGVSIESEKGKFTIVTVTIPS